MLSGLPYYVPSGTEAVMMPDFPGNSVWCQDAWGFAFIARIWAWLEVRWGCLEWEPQSFELQRAGSRNPQAVVPGAAGLLTGCLLEGMPTPLSISVTGTWKCQCLICFTHRSDAGPGVVLHVKLCCDSWSVIQMWIAISVSVMKRTDTQGSHWPPRACRDLLPKELLVAVWIRMLLFERQRRKDAAVTVYSWSQDV